MATTTAFHAAEALLDLLVANRSTVNANADLVAAGYAVSVDAGIGADAKDTSPYRYLKLDDRALLPPSGLTICFIGQSDDMTPDAAPYFVRVASSVNIVAYVQEPDPHKAMLAKRGIAQALSDLYDAPANRKLTMQDGSVFYDCRITGREFYAFDQGATRAGVALHVAALKWAGKMYPAGG